MKLPPPSEMPAAEEHLERLLAIPAAERSAYLAALADPDLRSFLQQTLALAPIIRLDPDKQERLPILLRELRPLTPEQREADVATIEAADPELGMFLRGALGLSVSLLSLSAGDLLDGYQLVELLNAGSFGQVWRATEQSTGRTVAIKFLHPRLLLDDLDAAPQCIAKFRDEIRLLSKFRNSHIVRLLRTGDIPLGWGGLEVPFCVMEYEDADPVHPSAHLPDRDARLRCFLQVCDAVADSHHRGLVHLDLNPNNVRVRPSGDAVLIDFGLAAFLDATRPCPSSLLGLGTLPYMAPEQISGQHGTIGRTTDVHALGVILFQMLSSDSLPYTLHEHPSPAQRAAELCQAILSPERRKLRELRADAPPALEEIVATAIHPEPKERFSDAGALRDALEAWLKEGSVGPPQRLENCNSRLSQQRLAEAYGSLIRSHPDVGWLRFPDGPRPTNQAYVERGVVAESSMSAERGDASPTDTDASSSVKSKSGLSFPQGSSAFAEERLFEEQLKANSRKVVEFSRALQVQRRLLLEAPAAMGKTALTKALAFHCQEKLSLIPIWIEFKTFSRAEQSLESFLTQDYERWLGADASVQSQFGAGGLSLGHWLWQQWSAGSALLILDGADEEYSSEARTRALTRIPRGATPQGRSWVLVTARPLDEPGFAGFGRVELRPLQMSEMMALAMTFASNQRHTELARQFCARLRGSDGRRARELARRPGHALQMLDVYFQTNGTVLIEYEEDLLDRVADDRLAKQIHASGIPNSTVLRQRQVLEYLAFQALVNFNGAALTHERMCDLSRLAQRQTLEGGEEVFTQPDGEAMLEDLRKRTGLLRRRWDGRWDFETIVWQEFLAACHFARMLERPESDLRKWLIGGPDSMANEAGGEAGHFSSRPFGAYLWHRAWHPWLLYTAGRMADGSELLTRTLAEKDCVFWRMLTLAIQMLARSTTVRLKILEQVQNKLEGLWSSPWFRTSNKDAVALISLGLARNPEYARCLNSALIQLLGTNRHTEQAFAVAALIQIGDPGALEAFMRLAADPGSAMDLRERSVAGIGRIATAGAVRTLMAFASDDSLPKPVRTRAVAELGRIGATEATGLLENIRRENTGGLAVFAAFALESITGSAVVQATVQNPPTGTPPKSEETSLWEDDELFQLLKLQANKMGQAFPEAEKLLDLPDSPELVETLCSVALDKTAKPDLRVAAVERLSRMENERVREGLLPIVEDHEDVFLVRLMALVSVATSDSLRVSEALVKILGDEQDHLRERVAVALERRRDSTAANAAACLVMAGRGTPKMIGLCLRILSATGGVEAIPAIRKALAWQDMEVRRAAVTAAGDCADVKHAKELLAMARQAIAENSPLASTWIESLWRLSERHCLRMFEDGHPMPFPELQRKLP